MIKHIYEENRAMRFLHKIDLRDWEDRHFLLAPEEEAQVGRDSEILFQAIEELQKKAQSLPKKVSNAH